MELNEGEKDVGHEGLLALDSFNEECGATISDTKKFRN